MEITKTRVKLKNGLPLVIVETPGAKTAVVSLLTQSGTRYNPAGLEGLSHILEHMLCKKSKKYPTELELAYALEKFGAWKNAWTSLEENRFAIESSAKDLKTAMEVQGDLLINPIFDEQSLSAEKKVIEKEILRKDASSEDLVWDVMREILYPGTPLAFSNLGDINSLKKIAVSDLESFRSENFFIENSVLAVCGGVNKEEVVNLAEEAFSGFGKSGSKEIPLFKYPRNKSIAIKKKSLPSVSFQLGFRLEKANADVNEMVLLRAILGAGWSSRFAQRLRLKESLVYDWGDLFRGKLLDTGNFLITLSTGADKFEKLLKVTCEEIVRIRDEQIPKSELEKAKGFVAGSLDRRLQTPMDWANWYGYDELMWPDEVESPEKYIEKIKKVSAKDLQRVAKKYFTKDNWYLAVVGNVAEAQIKVDL